MPPMLWHRRTHYLLAVLRVGAKWVPCRMGPGGGGVLLTRGLASTARPRPPPSLQAMADILFQLFKFEYGLEPFMLVVDDAQQMDASSMEFIADLLQVMPTVFAVVATRDSAIDDDEMSLKGGGVPRPRRRTAEAPPLRSGVPQTVQPPDCSPGLCPPHSPHAQATQRCDRPLR